MIKQAWITEHQSDKGRPLGLVTLSLKISRQEWESKAVPNPIVFHQFCFPSRDCLKEDDIVLTLSLLEDEDLVYIHDAIEDYFANGGDHGTSKL